MDVRGAPSLRRKFWKPAREKSTSGLENSDIPKVLKEKNY
jgi:hypothetical protein